eukprot:jgi/Psemu1/6236/gm1.6236_g
MPITNLVRLQSKCMSAGYLTYSGLPPPNTKVIDTACNTYLKTLGLPSNTLVQHILQTSPNIKFLLHVREHYTSFKRKLTPKIRFSHVDTHSSIQVPPPPPTLVGVHIDSIHAEALASFPSLTFAAFAISITPKNTVTLFRTWTYDTLLPGDFISAASPASQVRSPPLDHNGSANSMPQFIVDIPDDHPIKDPLPVGSYNDGFTTWIAAMRFLAAKNQALSLHIHHSLFDAINWTDLGPSHTILPLLGKSAAALSPTTTPVCCAVSLPFIDEKHLIRLRAIGSSLPDYLPTYQETPQPHNCATTTSICDLVNPFIQPRPNPCARNASGRSAWSWQIFLTHEHSNGVTGKYTIHLTTLSPVAKALFLEKPAIYQTAALNDKINRVAKHCHPENILPFVDITCGQFDPAFLHVVTNFVMMHTPLKQNCDILDSSPLIFNFLCIPDSKTRDKLVLKMDQQKERRKGNPNLHQRSYNVSLVVTSIRWLLQQPYDRVPSRRQLKPTPTYAASVSPSYVPPPSTSTKQGASVPDTCQEDLDYQQYLNSVENNLQLALHENIPVDDLFDNGYKALVEKVFKAPHTGSFGLEDVVEKIEDLVLKERTRQIQPKTSQNVLCNDCLDKWLSTLTLYSYLVPESRKIFTLLTPRSLAEKLVDQEEDLLKGLVLLWLVGWGTNDKVSVKNVTLDGNQPESNIVLPHDDDGKQAEDKGNKSGEGNMDKNGNGSADDKDANLKNNGGLKPATKKTTSKEPGKNCFEGMKELQEKDLNPFLYHFKTGFDILCAKNGHLVLTILDGYNQINAARTRLNSKKEKFDEEKALSIWEEIVNVAMDHMWVMGIIFSFLLCGYLALEGTEDIKCYKNVANKWCNMILLAREHIKKCIHFHPGNCPCLWSILWIKWSAKMKEVIIEKKWLENWCYSTDTGFYSTDNRYHGMGNGYTKHIDEVQKEDLNPFLYHFETRYDCLCNRNGHLVLTPRTTFGV